MTGLTMHVIGSLDGGGAERLLSNLVTQQRATPAPSCIVCLRPNGAFRSTLEASGVEVIDLNVGRRWLALGALVTLARLIRARRPAVVQGWMYHANVFATMALRLAGRRDTRLLWGIFCSDMDASQYPWRNVRLVRAISRRLSPLVDGIIYNAAEAREFHRAAGFCEPRALVIPNCLDTTTFRHDPDVRRKMRRELGIADDAVMVVMAARVDPMKNWTGVLNALNGIPGVVTVAIGQGTNKLPPQPGFIGLGWRDDVQGVFSAADVFLLASAFGEGSSLALSEAMSCSLPCVVTDVGGNGSAVGDAGVVIPRTQTAVLRDVVLELASDRGRREDLGRKARERISTAHSADDVAAMLHRFVDMAGGVA